jgi:8-amino-7-oxononanoate synthase
MLKLLRLVKKAGLYPEIVEVKNDNSKDPYFTINDKRMLSFNSCNYLGLSNSEEVKKVISESFSKYGVHPSNSTLVGGLWEVHRDFEKNLANFFGYEDSMLFATTSAVNVGVIPAISNLPLVNVVPLVKLITGSTDTTIFSDELNHATIVDGCRISKCRIEIYKHLNMDDLEQKLKKCKTKRKIIITDGVFSMDGDLLDLRKMVEIKEKYKALLYVDDAHSVGVLGKNGRGLPNHFGLKAGSGIDFYVVSLSKGFGITGGAVCASKDFIDYLRVTSRSYIFSRTYLTPMAEGGLKVLEILNGNEGSERIKKLWDSTNYLIDSLKELGFNTLKTETPIVPILIGDEKKAINLTNDLLEEGIYAPAMRWPAVAKGEARLRFMVTALHSKEDLDKLLSALEKSGRRNKIIK